METMTLTSYAKRIGVSQQRVSQYKRDGLLDGCYVMNGRRCLIDVAAADERLRGCLDPGQPARKAKVPKPATDADIEKAADIFCDKLFAVLYGVYVLSDVMAEPLKSQFLSRIEAVAALFRDE